MALVRCASLLEANWTALVLKPPVVVTAVALVAAAMMGSMLGVVRNLVHLSVVTAVYGATLVTALWLFFPDTLRGLLVWIPGARVLGFARPLTPASEQGLPH